MFITKMLKLNSRRGSWYTELSKGCMDSATPKDLKVISIKLVIEEENMLQSFISRMLAYLWKKVWQTWTIFNNAKKKKKSLRNFNQIYYREEKEAVSIIYLKDAYGSRFILQFETNFDNIIYNIFPYSSDPRGM